MDEAEARRHREVVQALINDAALFHAEARYQRVCAVCGSTDDYHAHHVYPRQRLKREHKPQFDPRNALRLCIDCHFSFEWGGVNRLVIATAKLKSINICYIWELLGDAGGYFLTEKYTGADERWEEHLRGGCECQLSLPPQPISL
jgi:hypothetical protein